MSFEYFIKNNDTEKNAEKIKKVVKIKNFLWSAL